MRYTFLMRERMRRGFSSFALTAALSIGILIFAITYTFMPKTPANSAPQIATIESEPIDPDMVVADPRSTATSSVSGLSPLGDAIMNKVITAYSSNIGDGGIQSDATTTAIELVKNLKPVVQAKTYSVKDVKATPDVSLERVLKYRSDLRDSLAPLLSISEPEYVTFGRYIQTHDAAHLALLERDAELYRTAASSTLAVVAPNDAIVYHLGILNAMEGFAAKLEALASHASDPFAAAALLRSYNEGEQDVLMSFNKLAQYYRAKAGVATSTTS